MCMPCVYVYGHVYTCMAVCIRVWPRVYVYDRVYMCMTVCI